MTYPESVAGWAAHAPSDVVKIPNGDLPMGIVACGDNDPRLGATLAWFKDFCASGRRATWVEIPNDAHVRNGKFESFVRDWFAAEAVRRNCKGKGMWCDLGNGEPIASGAACAKANRSWFPSKSVYEKWRNLVADMSRKVEVRRVHTQIKANPTLTLFLMPSTNVSKRVLCLSLLANRPSDVAWLLRKRSRKGTVGSFLDYAEENDMAVVAWGAPRGLWKPRFNWEDLRQDENRHIFRSFGYAANAWCKAMDGLASDFGLPRTGYYMAGSSGAAQFAQRLALHAPERFRAVAIHISSSYDYPLSSARSILWCVTTGENEPGYERSLRFLEAARSNKYPIIYKAYPGLGHADYPFACTLAKTCFAYATEGKSREGLNWTIVADVVNQSRHPRCLADEVPLGFRIFLPDEKVAKAWERF